MAATDETQERSQVSPSLLTSDKEQYAGLGVHQLFAPIAVGDSEAHADAS